MGSPAEQTVQTKFSPYPIENLEEDLSTAFELIARSLMRVDAAITNPVVKGSPIAKKKLKMLKYKLKTCKALISECVNQQ